MKFSKTQVFNMEAAIRGMRNPLNSWEKSDSFYGCESIPCRECKFLNECNRDFPYKDYHIGENDLKLAQNLLKGGDEHAKFMRMIHVSVDVDMPRYWWSEADTYHFNTKNSCSTMHKLLNNTTPIDLNMFVFCEEDLDLWTIIINRLEELRKEYKEIQATTKDVSKMNRLLVRAKRLLPEGFLQLRTLDTNYAEIRKMYFQRKNHRLREEWIDTFCSWVEKLPYFEELIAYKGE